MATNLFEIPEWLDYANFDNYPSEENPTTNAGFINYARNQNKLVGALTGALLWQPNTNFIAGKIIISPNMPEGMEAVALTGGVTGTAEPAWESGTEEYQDSGVKWKLRYKHWSKSVEKIADLTTGAINRLPNKAYAVGNVVYTDSNLSVALKCVTAGTTSNTELDISTEAVGSSITDGSVVWKAVARSNVLDEGGTLPVTKGGTGAITANGARLNLKTRIMSFDSFEKLELTQTTVTLETLYQAFKNVQQTENASAGMFLMCNMSTNTVTGLGLPPSLSGTLFVKHFNDRTQLEFMVDDGLIYTAKYGITTGLRGWNRLSVYEYTKTGNTERYSEGLQICKGTIEVGNTEPEVVNFNLPFVDVGEYQVFLQTVSAEEPLTMTATVKKIDGSSFEVRGSYDLYGYSWIAIGRWK